MQKQIFFIRLPHERGVSLEGHVYPGLSFKKRCARWGPTLAKTNCAENFRNRALFQALIDGISRCCHWLCAHHNCFIGSHWNLRCRSRLLRLLPQHRCQDGVDSITGRPASCQPEVDDWPFFRAVVWAVLSHSPIRLCKISCLRMLCTYFFF